jgi:hypothetical protein
MHQIVLCVPTPRWRATRGLFRTPLWEHFLRYPLSHSLPFHYHQLLRCSAVLSSPHLHPPARFGNQTWRTHLACSTRANLHRHRHDQQCGCQQCGWTSTTTEAALLQFGVVPRVLQAHTSGRFGERACSWPNKCCTPTFSSQHRQEQPQSQLALARSLPSTTTFAQHLNLVALLQSQLSTEWCRCWHQLRRWQSLRWRTRGK